jgi:hypothetical protein
MVTDVSNEDESIKCSTVPHKGIGGFPVEWFWRYMEELENNVEDLLDQEVSTLLTNAEKEHLERVLTNAREAVANLKRNGEDQGTVRPTYEMFREKLHAVLTLGAAGVARQAAKKILAPPIRRDDGRRGVTKSLATRREREKKDPGLKHMEELAKEARIRLPHSSQDRLASEIEDRWKLEKLDPPTHETIVTRIRKMEKAGLLPKRVLRPKASAGSRK